MALDENREIDAKQLLVQDAYLPVDNAEIDFWRVAEDEGCQRVMHCSSSQIEGIEAVTNEIGGHTWRKVANIIAT